MKFKLWPISVAVFVCLLGYGARQCIGTVYGAAEARDLLEALARAGLYLGSAVATASATSLALMLTLVGMIRRAETDFDGGTYQRILAIAGLSTASLMVSLVLLLAFVFPVGEFDQLPASWYGTLYEALFTVSVIMVALLAATVTMTYLTLRYVISRITPGDDV